jgi:hypothetical protein
MMEPAQEPPREQRFDLQQMLRELAAEATRSVVRAAQSQPASQLPDQGPVHGSRGTAPGDGRG